MEWREVAMRSRKPRGGIHLGSVLGSLLVTINVLVAGCIWVPDYVHPSPHTEDINVIAESKLKKIPFSIARTVRPTDDGQILAEFEWEARGYADWFEEFGLGTKATYWRFVLFGPDGSIICGNKWEPTNEQTNKMSCPLKQSLIGAAVAADIDYTYDTKPPGEKDFYKSVGRVFYFLERYKGAIGPPPPHGNN
jgi:hypothetical protein